MSIDNITLNMPALGHCNPILSKTVHIKRDKRYTFHWRFLC